MPTLARTHMQITNANALSTIKCAKLYMFAYANNNKAEMLNARTVSAMMSLCIFHKNHILVECCVKTKEKKREKELLRFSLRHIYNFFFFICLNMSCCFSCLRCTLFLLQFIAKTIEIQLCVVTVKPEFSVTKILFV